MIISIIVSAILLVLLEPFLTYLLDKKNLRRFPTLSPLSGITNAPLILLRHAGFRSRAIHASHKTHPVLRLGPNTLSFSSPAAIRAIYGHATPCVKGGFYAHIQTPHPGLIEVVDKPTHAAKRRILSHAFATRNLEGWEHKVADKIRRLLGRFDGICEDGGGDGVVDFRKWVNLFTVEAIVDIALSQRLGCLERGDDVVRVPVPGGGEKRVSFIEGLHAPRRATSTIVWSSWFRVLKFVLRSVPGFFRSGWKAGEDFNDLLSHLVRERVRMHDRGDEVDDLATCLLRDKSGRPRNLDIAEIEGDMGTLLDAGSDTTAIALTHAMYFLLKNPAALSRLRREVDANAFETLQDDPVAAHARVKNLPYLRACLDESLRLLPPVCAGLHRVTPPGGLVIDGHRVEGGTVVAVPIYTAHRNPVLFPDPETYRPERWLTGGGVEDAQASFMPFSAGARGCIGRNITYIEQTMLLASLVRRYEFSFTDEGFEISHEEAFNLWPGPLLLRMRRRS